MADEADLAQLQIEADLGAALRKRQKTIMPVGECYYCGMMLRDGFLFCDKDCAQDYEREQRIKSIAGTGRSL